MGRDKGAGSAEGKLVQRDWAHGMQRIQRASRTSRNQTKAAKSAALNRK